MVFSIFKGLVFATLLCSGFAQENTTNPVNVTNTTDFTIDLSMLGEPTWSRLRPGWSLTVNDQCVYEFIFQFEHDDTLPLGTQNFEAECRFKDPETKIPFVADDNMFYLDPRRMWERFPSYVWATIGFNHLSVDWYPCGHRPRGYSKAQYSFAFYRVTPEFRALAMTCEEMTDEQVVVPGERLCNFEQETINGMNFYILPAALRNKEFIVNMPTTFERPELGNGPVPHVGLRSWDQNSIPATPNRWTDSPVFMASYAGDLVMWEAKAPFSRLSGDKSLFTSNAYRFYEPTVESLPDTHAFHWDHENGFIRFHMVGQAGLCKSDFERAQADAGGAPVFPNWDDVFGDSSGATDDANSGNTNDETASSSPLLIVWTSLVSTFVSAVFLL